MASSPHLLMLPTELHDEIISLLSFPEVIRLKLSCRYFHSLIPAPTHQQLLDAEQTFYALRRNLFACQTCIRLRPGARFISIMRMNKMMRGGKEASHRICLDCAAIRYARGDHIVLGTQVFMICARCLELKSRPFNDPEAKECSGCKRMMREQRLRGEAELARQLYETRIRAYWDAAAAPDGNGHAQRFEATHQQGEANYYDTKNQRGRDTRFGRVMDFCVSNWNTWSVTRRR